MDESLEKQINALTARAINPVTLAQDVRDFEILRANTRGAIITAHHALDPHVWTAADDKMLDMVTVWLDNLRNR